MQFMIRPRQGGKTHETVEWLRADPLRVLIVHDETERKRLMDTYKVPSGQIYNAQTCRARLAGRGVTEVAVENLDLILGYLLGVYNPIVRVTATGEVI